MFERAVPILPGDDLGVARDFYVGKLGFQVQLEATDDGKDGILGLERLERGTIEGAKMPKVCINPDELAIQNECAP